jgi:plastocyanin
VVMVGSGSTYSVTFRTPATYEYQCGVHGSAMTGRIVVLP